MDQYFELLQELFEKYGSLIVFLVLMLENFPFLGFLAPAITLLIIVGFLLAPTPLALATTMGVAYLAIVLGDNIWFFIGKHSAGRWHILRNVNSRANTALEVVSRQPKWLMFLYQFPPYFRMFLPFGLGVARYPIPLWILINLVGSFLYVITFITVGYVAFQIFESVEAARYLGKNLTYIITFYGLIYLIVLINQYVKRRRSRE